MQSIRKVAVIGNGRIGRHLQDRLTEKGNDVVCMPKGEKTETSFLRFLTRESPAAVFLAIPTADKGEAALGYILACVQSGIPIITCEKGALAYHSEILKRFMHHIGFSATVGGGTMMLKYMKIRHIEDREVEIHAVLNGTLNYIFDGMGHGRSMAEVCCEAAKAGYAEPGSADPVSLIEGEVEDALMKTCALFNTTLSKVKDITPDYFSRSKRVSKEFNTLARSGADYRFVVTFTKQKPATDDLIIGTEFDVYIREPEEQWYIVGAFRHVGKSSQLSSWIPSGAGNAVRIIEGELGSGGIYCLLGPGAGPEPTTLAMLADFAELCPK